MDMSMLVSVVFVFICLMLMCVLIYSKGHYDGENKQRKKQSEALAKATSQAAVIQKDAETMPIDTVKETMAKEFTNDK